MSTPTSLQRLLGDNLAALEDILQLLPRLNQTQARSVTTKMNQFATLFCPDTKLLEDLLSLPDDTQPVQLLLFLDPAFRDILAPFELTADEGAPMAADKKAAFTLVQSIITGQAPYVIYELIPATDSSTSCFRQAASTLLGHEAATVALSHLPLQFVSTDVDFSEVPLSFNILSANGIKHFRPETTDLSADLSNLSISSTQATFDEQLAKSGIIRNLASSMEYLVSQAQSANLVAPSTSPATAAPSSASLNAVHRAGLKRAVDFPDEDVHYVYPQSDSSKLRSDSTIATKGMFDDVFSYYALYGTNSKLPNVSNAYEAVGAMLQGPTGNGLILGHTVQPRYRKPFLLMGFQESSAKSTELLHLWSLTTMTGVDAFNSDAIFWNSRFTLAFYTSHVFGPTISAAIHTLFDLVYMFMVEYKFLSWKYIEDFLVNRLNRLRRLRTMATDTPSFNLAKVVDGFFSVQLSDFEYHFRNAPSRVRSSCPCLSSSAPTSAAKSTGAAPAPKSSANRLQKTPLPTASDRNPNHDWHRGQGTPDTSIGRSSEHPCYYWALQDTQHPCPITALGQICPCSHAWPKNMTVNTSEVKTFLKWVRREKLF
jgi:hypothetical protein